ncbi:hypothetical protein BQ8794_230083 [Mesorhizobium prunaredense]|uniref:Uncharacterized protein n=1 Tax=Mesorhizobium prunaredense TaxID=1631249 RepID=A0A1R3V7C4_9HYPH|nr:hypothetical protein BQ8794_230083 [Mesorhizobium prunaredense]
MNWICIAPTVPAFPPHIRRWDAQSHHERTEFGDTVGGLINDILFSPDGTRLLTTAWDKPSRLDNMGESLAHHFVGLIVVIAPVSLTLGRVFNTAENAQQLSYNISSDGQRIGAPCGT